MDSIIVGIQYLVNWLLLKYCLDQTYISIGYPLFKLKLIEGIKFENKAYPVFE